MAITVAFGRVVDGQAEVDGSMITCGSRPVPRSVGDEVVAGTGAIESALRVQITAAAVLMSLSTIVVALNAQLLRRVLARLVEYGDRPHSSSRVVFASFGVPIQLADPALKEAVRAARAPYLEDDGVPSPDGTPADRPMQ